MPYAYTQGILHYMTPYLLPLVSVPSPPPQGAMQPSAYRNAPTSFDLPEEGFFLLAPMPVQDSNPFHFEDSQVVLQVSHNIVTYAPIRVLFKPLLIRR
jgi:hypothetical protein